MTRLLFALIIAGLPYPYAEAGQIFLVTHPGLSEHHDEDRSGQTQVKQYQGQVTGMKGDRWTIKDTEGQEVHLKVDRQTSIDGRRPEVGDRIEALVRPNGVTETIRHIAQD